MNQVLKWEDLGWLGAGSGRWAGAAVGAGCSVVRNETAEFVTRITVAAAGFTAAAEVVVE